MMKKALSIALLAASAASAQTLKEIKLDATEVKVGQTVTASVGLDAADRVANCGMRVKWGVTACLGAALLIAQLRVASSQTASPTVEEPRLSAAYSTLVTNAQPKTRAARRGDRIPPTA